MRCPKCEYTSFDHLPTCRKCGADLKEFKARFKLSGAFFSEPSCPSAADSMETFEDDRSSRSEPVPDPAAVDSTTIGSAAGYGEKRTPEIWEAEQPTGFDFAEEADWAFSAPEDEPECLDDGDDPEKTPEDLAGIPAGREEEKKDGPVPIRLSLDDFDRPKPNGKTLSLFDTGPISADLEDPVESSAEFRTASRAETDPEVSEKVAEDLDGTAATEDDEYRPAEPVTGAAAAEISAHETRPNSPPSGRRLAAGLVDALILLTVFLLFLLVGEMALVPAGAPSRPLPAVLLEQAIPYFLVLFCLGFGYFTFFHFLLGQTLGKMLFRLRVETVSGEPMTLSRIFLRSTGGLLSLLTGGLGYLPVLLPGGRGWNDRLAGTRVVQAREIGR